eukprot:3049117-Pyramimonas_sp.AAC.1
MLPKLSGGARPNALLNATFRTRARARWPLSAPRETGRQRPSFWSSAAGRSPSDCPFPLNMTADAARARKHHVNTVFLDMLKLYDEAALWGMIPREARGLGFVPRLWM